MTQNHHTYKNNPRWNVLIENGRLLITKGADELYLVDEVGEAEAITLYDAYRKGSLAGDEIQSNANLRDAVSKMEKAGVVYRSATLLENQTTPLLFSLRWHGTRHQRIDDMLVEYSKDSQPLSLTGDEAAAGLLVLIRSSGRLTDILHEYNAIDRPHLFVDIAYDHTISLGPLVFPRETACLACFVGRLTRNWGDAEPPRISQVSDSAELIAALILEQLKVFQHVGSCPELIERAWTMNLADWTTKVDSIFRLPWCPTCYPVQTSQGTGSFELPWRLKAGQE